MRFTGDDEERTEQLNDVFTGEEKRLNIKKHTELALKLASLYGGSLLIALTDEEKAHSQSKRNKPIKRYAAIR